MKSWLEISKARLLGNLRTVEAAVGPRVETLAVVKANGYGHNASMVAGALVEGGVKWLGVTDAEEGALVRAAVGRAVRILVMSGMEAQDTETFVAKDLTPVVWTVAHIAAMEQAARARGKSVRVQLEVDTGMSRQGVGLDGLGEVLEKLAACEWVTCEAVLTHLACAETVGSAMTGEQREKFGAAIDRMMEAGVRPEWVHLGNTSAVDEGSTMEWVRATAERVKAGAMVRTGLALYGECLELQGLPQDRHLGTRLEPVLTWWTRVIGLREIEAGSAVGYGATFTATHAMRLALLPVGYADGFRREASSGVGDGWVCLQGERAQVVGRVSMNLTVVDVTDLAAKGLDVRVGDVAVLLGEGVTAADHARWCGTIPYEILCGVRGHTKLV